MATDNNTILTSIYLSATNDYQQRIPDPTQSKISATMDALFDPMNRSYFNQFMDILVNRIAFTYVRGKRWDNPLAVFKGAKVNYGSTIQEIAPKWIKAHSYEDAAETLLKLHRPEAEAWYHSQNRRDKYPITINREELRTAFTDEYGLNNLVSQIMSVPMSSDNYDEYRIMLELIGLYEHKWGFFKHRLSAVPTDEATGKEFLTAIKTYAGQLQFPSSLYNAAAITDIPVFANPGELVLFVTPATNASVDVNTLASVFHLDKADETRVRKIIVDELPIPNAVALLTTEDFFVCNDTLYENSSFWNPERLDTTYFLHHWGIYSVSPFVPAILFTTDEGTQINRVTETVTGINVTADPTTVAPDGETFIDVQIQGNINPDNPNINVAPNAATYELSADNDVQLGIRTYVDEYGILHVGKDVPDGTKITVTATSTYVNPSGKTTEYTNTVDVTVDESAPIVRLTRADFDGKPVAQMVGFTATKIDDDIDDDIDE